MNSFDNTKTHTFLCNVYNPDNNVTISLIAQDTTGTLSQKVNSTTVNSGSGADITPVSISSSQLSGYNRMKIRITHVATGIVYVDNLKLLTSN